MRSTGCAPANAPVREEHTFRAVRRGRGRRGWERRPGRVPVAPRSPNRKNGAHSLRRVRRVVGSEAVADKGVASWWKLREDELAGRCRLEGADPFDGLVGVGPQAEEEQFVHLTPGVLHVQRQVAASGQFRTQADAVFAQRYANTLCPPRRCRGNLARTVEKPPVVPPNELESECATT